MTFENGLLELMRILRKISWSIAWPLMVLSFVLAGVDIRADQPVQIGLFDVDASPPIGGRMAYDATIEVLSPLRCTGIVIMGAESPIVLCAVDWIGIGNEGHRRFREQLALAVGTSPDRVAVHALHQHDAPWCDFDADALVDQQGVVQRCFDSLAARDVIQRAAQAAKRAVETAAIVTHVGIGRANVLQVASNRRILGADGKVKAVRFTASQDPALQAAPEGVIDSELKSISFWNKDQRLVEITFYATHPQSYYRTGKANPDYPGMARDNRQAKTGVQHVHFTGAGGNVGAGKYNDGSPELRAVLTARMETAMQAAWDNCERFEIQSRDIQWRTQPVCLPASPHLNEQTLLSRLHDPNQPSLQRCYAAVQLIWLKRCQEQQAIDIGCLALGKTRVLHMPGELFVEYQLAAQALRPDLFVAMAAYGDYGPWYIGTEIAYEQGGYETGPGVSLVGPGCESILVGAMEKLLDAPAPLTEKLGVKAAEIETQQARREQEK